MTIQEFIVGMIIFTVVNFLVVRAAILAAISMVLKILQKAKSDE